MMSHAVKIRKFKMYERQYGAENFCKDLFFSPLQPGIHKNSEGLAILILEFDDIVVKTLYSLYKNHALAKQNCSSRQSHCAATSQQMHFFHCLLCAIKCFTTCKVTLAATSKVKTFTDMVLGLL